MVPAAALAIILLLKPAPAVAIGLAILVACPPAPLMIKATPKMGKGNAAFMASLHLSLALLAFFTVPLGLYLLSMPLGFHADVHLGVMGMILGRTIFLPLLLGMAVCAVYPRLAQVYGPKLDKAGGIGLLIVVLFALVVSVPWLLQMGAWSYLVIALVSMAALSIGHCCAPRDADERTTLAVESGVRHPVLAITIAVSSFSRAEALPVLIPCVLVFILIALLYLFCRGRMKAKTD